MVQENTATQWLRQVKRCAAAAGLSAGGAGTPGGSTSAEVRDGLRSAALGLLLRGFPTATLASVAGSSAGPLGREDVIRAIRKVEALREAAVAAFLAAADLRTLTADLSAPPHGRRRRRCGCRHGGRGRELECWWRAWGQRRRGDGR